MAIKRKRRRWRAFRQGDLDGLCGVYSVVNAVRSLCPEIRRDAAAWLFAELLQSLLEAGANPSRAVSSGIGRATLIALLREAASSIENEYDVTLTFRRLPLPLRQTKKLDVLWVALSKAISSTTVAILGLGGTQSHWTVAVKVSDKQITLFDSSRMVVLRRSDCSVREMATRTAIAPAYVIVVTRKAGD